MVRTAHFTDADILAEARYIAAREGLGGLTVARLAKACGAPTGSIYHRFSGLGEIRGLLLAPATEAAVAALLTALPDRPDRAGTALLGWARGAPEDARLLSRAQGERVTLPPAFEARCLAARATLDAALEAALEAMYPVAVEATHPIADEAMRTATAPDRLARIRFFCVDGPTAAIAAAQAVGALNGSDLERTIAEIGRLARHPATDRDCGAAP